MNNQTMTGVAATALTGNPNGMSETRAEKNYVSLDHRVPVDDRVREMPMPPKMPESSYMMDYHYKFGQLYEREQEKMYYLEIALTELCKSLMPVLNDADEKEYQVMQKKCADVMATITTESNLRIGTPVFDMLNNVVLKKEQMLERLSMNIQLIHNLTNSVIRHI